MELIFDFDRVIVKYGLFFKKDSKLILRLLQSNGHNLKIVTSRGSFGCFVIKMLLWLNDVAIPVIKAGKNDNKATFAVGADFFVDDKNNHVEDVAKVVKNVYVFSQEKHPKFSILSNWWDIYWEVDRISRELPNES